MTRVVKENVFRLEITTNLLEDINEMLMES